MNRRRSTDAWAVGEQNSNQTVTEHWNGAAWTLVPSPSVTVGTTLDTLTGVSAIGRSDVWTVGYTTLQNSDQTLAEHWDGTAWQIVPSANPGPGSNALNGLAQTAPGGPLRAVGLSQWRHSPDRDPGGDDSRVTSRPSAARPLPSGTCA